MVAAAKAPGAASLQILDRTFDGADVILELAESKVALATEQPAVLSAHMAMVEHETATAIVSAAKVAEERSRRTLGLFSVEAVALHQVADRRRLSGPPVVPVVGRTALSPMLRAIFAHSAVLANPARRLAAIFGNVVEPELGDRMLIAAPRASLLFHSIYHNRIGGFRRAADML